jgi:uncharacterized OB-fold protein
MTDPMPPRALPLLDDNNTAFWTGGKKGELLIHRCSDCGYYVHPPVNFCPECEGRQVAPQPVSGKGTVETLTVVHQQWVPGLKVPYVLALVTIAEQDDVRLACNIVNCAPEDVTFGMSVKVLFEQNEDVWVPLFEPDNEAGEA